MNECLKIKYVKIKIRRPEEYLTSELIEITNTLKHAPLNREIDK